MSHKIALVLTTLFACFTMESCVSESPRRSGGLINKGASKKAAENGAKQESGSTPAAAPGSSWDGSTLQGTSLFKVIPVE